MAKGKRFAVNHFVVQLEHSTGIPKRDLSLLGEESFPALLSKKLHADLVLQPLHLQAYGRWRATQAL
jgi:hypothetical protein